MRSGDVLFVSKPFHVVSDYPRGTNHGTPYSYDVQVPVVFAGRGVKPGLYLREIDPVDVAPTLSALLEMGMPALAEGKAGVRKPSPAGDGFSVREVVGINCGV